MDLVLGKMMSNSAEFEEEFLFPSKCLESVSEEALN